MSYKNNTYAREKQRAAADAERRDSFIGRNYWLWVMMAFIAYPLATLLSAFTECSHIYLRLKATGAPIMLVIIVVVIIGFLIEMLCYTLGKGSVDDVQAGVFSGSGSDIAMFALKTCGFIAVLSFSIYLSVNGAPLLNEKLRQSYTPPEASFISIDSINAYYQAELLPHQESIADMRKTTWKGSITRTANKSIIASQELMKGIESRRAADLQAARLKNEQILQEWEEATATNSSYAMGFAGLGEIIKLFCLIFIGIYDQGLSKEAAVFGGSNTNSPSASSQQPIAFRMTNSNSNDTPTPTYRNPIGFKMPWLTEAPTEADNEHRVATCSNPRTSQITEGGVPIDAVKEFSFYKEAKRNYQSWDNHRNATAETKQKHMAKYEARMQHAVQNLMELGYRIEFKDRKYHLKNIE